MSPDRIELASVPTSVQIGAGDLDQALERFVAAREREAFARGVAEGEKRALDGAASALNQSVEAFETAHAEAARMAVELALEIARVLLRREARVGNYDLEKIVRESLSSSGVGRGRCIVHVNPDDARTLADTNFRAGTTVEADPNVSRGNVQISTPQGLLVREFEQALAAIGDELREEAA